MSAHGHPAEKHVADGRAIESSHGAHHDEERSPGGLNVGLIALVGVVSTILVYVTVLACMATYYEIRDRKWESLQTSYPVQREQYMAQQQMLLEGVYWTNKDKGQVSLPIDRAIEIVAKEGLQSGSK